MTSVQASPNSLFVFMKTNKLSRFLSLVLKHDPDQIGLTLDSKGWAEVDHLLAQLAAHGKRANHDDIDKVVAAGDQARFRFSEDRLKIRAIEGHSIDIDLELPPLEPPEFLYHGTAERFLKSIQVKGLNSRSKPHVHLSDDLKAITKECLQLGKPVILLVEAKRMFDDGYEFFLSESGIWMTKEVPFSYIERSD